MLLLLIEKYVGRVHSCTFDNVYGSVSVYVNAVPSRAVKGIACMCVALVCALPVY